MDNTASVDERDSGVAKDAAAAPEKKDIVALNFYKYRVDKNTMRITFMALPFS